MGYAPVTHAKEARMSALIMDVIPLFTLVASDEIRDSALSTPYEVSPSSWTKISELEVPMYYNKSGTVRAKVSAAMPNSGNGSVQFYVDGFKMGNVHGFNSPEYAVFSDDIEVRPGALIQVYVFSDGSAKTRVKNFQICADDAVHNINKGALW